MNHFKVCFIRHDPSNDCVNVCGCIRIADITEHVGRMCSAFLMQLKKQVFVHFIRIGGPDWCLTHVRSREVDNEDRSTFDATFSFDFRKSTGSQNKLNEALYFQRENISNYGSLIF